MTVPIQATLYVLCTNCKCCLIREGDTHHCFGCHNEIPLAEICGCDECVERVNAWARTQGWQDVLWV